MPRWLWISLASLVLVLCWHGLSPAYSTQITASNSSTNTGCPLPDKFRSASKPLQTDVNRRIQRMQMGESTITPLAGFSLQARVLARENYHLGNESDYSPTDLALGWGPMAEPGMGQRLNVTQASRWYRYSWGEEGPPLSQNEIVANSANMHMVPANRAVEAALSQVSENDLIELQGWLIRIDRNDGWHWQSSLSREDSGDGACELVYVCAIEVKH